jgi:ATP-binding cassette, subfamily B, bacterial PglK
MIAILNKLLSLRIKIYSFILVICVLLLSLLEVLSLQTIPEIMHYLQKDTNFEKSISITYFRIVTFEFNNLQNFLFYSIFLILSTVVARMFVIGATSLVSHGVAKEFSMMIINKLLSDPLNFTRNDINNEKYISLISNKLAYCTNTVLTPTITLFASVSFLLTFMVYLIFSYPVFSLWIFGILLSFYLIVALSAHKFLTKFSKEISHCSEQTVDLVSTISATKLELVQYNLQKNYSERGKEILNRIFFINVVSSVISACPRYLLEALLLISVVIVVYLSDFGTFLNLSEIQTAGILASFVYAGLKMLPMIQSVYQCIALITVGKETFKDIVYNLKDSNTLIKIGENYKSTIKINHKAIIVEDCSVLVKNKAPLLDKVNMTIKAGSRTAILGPSGTGKSTLLRLLGGYILPDTGSIIIGDQIINRKNVGSLRSNVSLTHQDPLLFNDTIRNNVLLGRKVDQKRQEEIFALTGLDSDSSSTNAFHLDKVLINRGENISGGQRQRIGLARALCDQRSILLLDEVTSALDETMANKIIDQIINSNTFSIIVMVTHSEDLARKFDQVIRLEREN